MQPIWYLCTRHSPICNSGLLVDNFYLYEHCCRILFSMLNEPWLNLSNGVLFFLCCNQTQSYKDIGLALLLEQRFHKQSLCCLYMSMGYIDTVWNCHLDLPHELWEHKIEYIYVACFTNISMHLLLLHIYSAGWCWCSKIQYHTDQCISLLYSLKIFYLLTAFAQVNDHEESSLWGVMLYENGQGQPNSQGILFVCVQSNIDNITLQHFAIMGNHHSMKDLQLPLADKLAILQQITTTLVLHKLLTVML